MATENTAGEATNAGEGTLRFSPFVALSRRSKGVREREKRRELDCKSSSGKWSNGENRGTKGTTNNNYRCYDWRNVKDKELAGPSVPHICQRTA